MKEKNYSITYLVHQGQSEIFNAIKDVRTWWSGLFSEEIKGSSDKLGDEFTFSAGNGVHYSKQKLVELIPDEKIVWLVTESNLSFIDKQDEWTGTQFCFECKPHGDATEVTFTHIGLTPEIDCYDQCSSAWHAYLEKFLSPLTSIDKSPSGIGVV